MKIPLLTLTFSLTCALSYAGSYLEKPQETRVRQSNSCTLEEFSSREAAERYIAQHGGEVYRDQDELTYRTVKCKFDISDRVSILSSLDES
jgi:hypothetical protein